MKSFTVFVDLQLVPHRTDIDTVGVVHGPDANGLNPQRAGYGDDTQWEAIHKLFLCQYGQDFENSPKLQIKIM